MNKIDELLNSLTLEEKACLLSGTKSWHSVKIPRLNIPSIFITDGPHGLRKKVENSKDTGLGQTEPSTCFPCASTSGMSWNKKLLYKMGEAMGKECNHYNVNVILGPAVNIKRNPLCGRSFEYFSEDPYLAGILGSELTKGIESRGVGTSVKHYCCNNNEGNRYFGDSIVDQRTLHEIYLKVFEHIVKKANPKTLMCSYNRVNGEYASENEYILNKVLRDEWGYKGLVMSDWGAVNDRVKGLKAGLDLEMPGDIKYNRTQIVNAVRNGDLSEETLNRSVKRVLEMVYSTNDNKIKHTADFELHSSLSRTIAEDSAVLLKNKDNILPLCNDKKFLIVGEMFEHMRYQGAGSSLIRPTKLVQPLDSFKENDVNYEYLKGYNLSSFVVDDKLEEAVINNLNNIDTILFFGGLSEEAESEGFDRQHMKLPNNQVHLINKLIKFNKKIVLVLFGGAVVELPFEEQIDAILNMYLPGQEGGNACYNLLFGKISPSGRLIETWPISYSDVPFGKELCKTTNDIYKESIYVGYRYYSSFNIPVRYPFGYGLSYSSFKYNNLRVEELDEGYNVLVDVTNTGKIDSSEVVQLYVGLDNPKIHRPLRELKAFNKVFLKVNETKTVEMYVDKEDLKIYQESWKLEEGNYRFEVAENVNKIILSTNIFINSDDQVVKQDKIENMYSSIDSILNIIDEDFEVVIGRKIESPIITRPYDLNSPISKFESVGGKNLFKLMKFAMKTNYKIALNSKNSKDKETNIKNAYFAMKTMESMSFRAISFASEGKISYRMAKGLVDISNNKPFKGFWKIITPEKGIKLPKQK